MKIFMIVYMIVSTLVALSTIGYVVVDIAIEKRRQANQSQPIQQPVPVAPPPPPLPIEPEVMPVPVPEIDAEEADALLSNQLAMETAKYEKGAGAGRRAPVNIGEIDKVFAKGQTVTIATLKAKGLVPQSAGRVKILADGILRKPLIVKAESFSVQAVKMIELTGGTVIFLRD